MTSTTQAHEFKAKTVDDAIAEGLKTLKVTRAQVEITVVHKGSRGILGFGSEPAVVRMTLHPQPVSQYASTTSTSVATPPTSVAATPMPPASVPPLVVPPLVVPTESAAKPTPSLVEKEFADDHEEIEAEQLEEAEAETPDEESNRAASSFMSQQPAVADLAQEKDQTGDALPFEQSEESDNDLEPLAIDLLSNLLRLMEFDAEIVASWQDDDQMEDLGSEEQEASKSKRYLLLDVRGAELGPLIGRRGETLDNLQYLLRLMVNQRLHKWKNIVVDVEQYKSRRVTQLSQLAQRMADQVSRSGRSVSLEPMPPNERRIVHMTLRDYPKVYTESIGDGIRRKVHIFAKNE